MDITIRIVELKEAEVVIKDAKTFDEAERRAIEAIKSNEVNMKHVGYTSFIK